MDPHTPEPSNASRNPHEHRLYSWRDDHPAHTAEQPAHQDHAAQTARAAAEHVYQNDPPNQLSQPAQTSSANPYAQTYQPVYDWQRYHTAWQQYYQEYYARHYQAWLQTQQAAARPAAPAPEPHIITGSDDIAMPRSRFQIARDELLAKVAERTTKFQRSNRYVPIMCVLVVVLLLLFIQYNRVLVAGVETLISPGSTVNADNSVIVDPASSDTVGPDAKLIIPKINVNVPVIYDVTTVDEQAIQNALERGVVHYNLPGASSVPGQNGNTVILGHSSNDVFDPGNYKFAFVLLDRLRPGDIFYLNYQSKRYTYTVTQKTTIAPGDWHALQQNDGKPNAILVTGTPASSATSRLLVYGQQVSPDPGMDSAAPPNNQDANPAGIPGNSPTFFDRLSNLLGL